MAFTDYAYDNFVAKDFSKFTSHSLQPITASQEEFGNKLISCILTSIFVKPVPNASKPLLFTIVRRAEYAFREYEFAREHLEFFTKRGRSVRSYFLGLSHMETALSACYQALDFGRKAIKHDLFKTGDGSAFERLNQIYSVIKHLGASSLQPDQLHLIWFTNDGVSTSVASLKFDEIVEVMTDLYHLVERLSKLA